LNANLFLDVFRPFRRGEIALARKAERDPAFLHPVHFDIVRGALRLAQLPGIGGDPDNLVDRLGNVRLRLLQLLAPVIPTDPERIEAAAIERVLPPVIRLVTQARERIISNGLASEERLDAELSHKRLVLVLGGAAGSGYVYLGALRTLERIGLTPDYLVGCSVGSLLAVVRGRTRGFDLEELFDDVRRLRERGVFGAPDLRPRFGLPAALRLDLQRALGDLFRAADGQQTRLGELAIPTDVLASGVGPGAFVGPPEAFARLVDAQLEEARDLSRLRGRALAAVVGRLVSLAMSRQVLVPLLLGADTETAQLAALDGAGFSAAIPGLLHYEPDPDDAASVRILESLMQRHRLSGIVDGALTGLVPARYAWEAIHAGRLGSGHCAIVALDAIASPRGVNAPLAPLLRVISAATDRDRPFWDLCTEFRRTPAFLDLFPTQARLADAARAGERDFAPTADTLRKLLAPVSPWQTLMENATAA
jgi:hypothetical protein